MCDQERRQQEERRSDDSGTPVLHKLFGTGRRVTATFGTVLVTAVIGWAVAYYAPGVLSHKTESPPVVTDVLDDPYAIDTFNNLPIAMLLPASAASPVTKNPPARWCSGFHMWGRRLGGADVNATHFRLIVQGTADKAVIITGISARVLNHKSVNGLNVVCPTAGAAQIRSLTMNLDSPNLSAVYLVKGSLSPFGFTLRKGETEVFDVTAITTSSEMLEWNILLHLTVDGREQTIVVQDRGAPFRTVAEHKGKWSVWTGSWSGGSPFKQSS